MLLLNITFPQILYKTLSDERKRRWMLHKDFALLSWCPLPRQLFVNIALTSRVGVGVDLADQHGDQCKCVE